jgi:hypothetical protein
MTTGTQTRPGDTTAEPKRRFRFPTAFTVLFFVLVLVWILTFIIKPGTYSYVSCDGGPPKPIPGTFENVKLDLSIQERLYDLWLPGRERLTGQACVDHDGDPMPASADGARQSWRRLR